MIRPDCGSKSQRSLGRERPASSPSGLYARAEIAAMLGDRDSAVTLLRQAFANGRLHTFWDHVTPAFETLRGDARYVAIMKPRE